MGGLRSKEGDKVYCCGLRDFQKVDSVGKTTPSAQLEHCNGAITCPTVSWTRQEVRRQLPPLIKASRHGLSHLMSRTVAWDSPKTLNPLAMLLDYSDAGEADASGSCRGLFVLLLWEHVFLCLCFVMVTCRAFKCLELSRVISALGV